MGVTAAIPVFNGLDYLKRTVPRVLEQGFQRVYIFDDASTDGVVDWGAREQGVTVISGNARLGPAGNRNRVLECETDDIILFLDADTEILSDDVASGVEREFACHQDMAIMGALIVDDQDRPIPYYCGYFQRPFLRGVSEALGYVAMKHSDDAEVMTTVREFSRKRIAHFEPIEDRTIDWVNEQFFAVRDDIFRKLGGFDRSYKYYHEGPDFCKRAKDHGYTVRTNPAFMARHLDMQTDSRTDLQPKIDASTAHWYRKHYDIPPQLIELFFLE
jgi:GT2 family glycosyltransferase